MIPFDTVLFTENYRLRIPNETDIEFVFSATRNSDFNKGMQWDAPRTKEELFIPLKNNIEAWKDGNGYSFTIETLESKSERVGRISIRKTNKKDKWNIGFWTHPSFQNKGIMTEVLEKIIEFSFDSLNADSICAKYATWNKSSEKVLLKNGFKFVRHLEKGFKKNGNWVSENELCVERKAYKNTKMKLESCDFCKILVNNKNIIYEDRDAVILLDIDPISLGHVLICPRKHYTDFHEMPNELIHHIMDLSKKYLDVLQRIFINKGYSLMLNAGEFNDLKHCHLHIFPRNSKEEFQWTYNEKKILEDGTKFSVLKKLFEGNI